MVAGVIQCKKMIEVPPYACPIWEFLIKTFAGSFYFPNIVATTHLGE